MTDHSDPETSGAIEPAEPELLPVEALRWLEHIAVLEFYYQILPRRTGQVAAALAFLDRELPMSSRDIARFARTGHETVRRSANSLEQRGLIDRHRRPIHHARIRAAREPG